MRIGTSWFNRLQGCSTAGVLHIELGASPRLQGSHGDTFRLLLETGMWYRRKKGKGKSICQGIRVQRCLAFVWNDLRLCATAGLRTYWEIHCLVSLEYGLDWNRVVWCRVVWCSGLRLIGQIKCEGFSMITHEKYNLPLASESAKFPLWYVLQYSACIPSSTQKTQVLRGHTRRTSIPTH